MATATTSYYIVQEYNTKTNEWYLFALCGNDIDKALAILETEERKHPELILELGICKRQW